MWLLSLTGYFFQLPALLTMATVLAWCFVALEFPRLKAKQRPLIMTLGFAGLCCSLLAWFYGSEVTLLSILGEHLKLAVLLTAISFIGMAVKPVAAEFKRGFRSFTATFLGMHAFSSVANFSALPVIGDQIQREGRLSPVSQSIMSRGFSFAVLWSPFLSIMPLVLEQVPGTSIAMLYPFTIPLAIMGLAFTLLEMRLRHKRQFWVYRGYPLKAVTLRLPLLLISCVLLLHALFPETSTVMLVAVIAVFIPLLLVFIQQGSANTSSVFKQQVFHKISESRTEISLFLCSGLLAAGVKACIGVGLLSLPFTETNAWVASFCLITVVAVASLGINQLAVVAIFAGLLADVTTTPTLMAVAYIYATALSMYSSVFSGTNMILQTRYNCSGREILRNQLPFTAVMLCVGVAMLFLMQLWGIR